MEFSFAMKRFRRLRRFLFRSVIALIVLIGVYWIFENWRGAKAWEEAKARIDEAGVSIVRADYAGPEIPEEDDLLKNLIFIAEFDHEREDAQKGWRMLFAEKRFGSFSSPGRGKLGNYRDYFETVMTEDEARQRMAEEASAFEDRLSALAEVILEKPVYQVFARGATDLAIWESDLHVVGVQGLIEGYQSSALMAIRSGNSTLAVERIQTLDRVIKISNAPSLVDALVAQVGVKIMTTIIWEGLQREVWCLEQIERLKVILTDHDLKQPYLKSLKHELAWGLESLDSLDEAEVQLEEMGGGVAGGIAAWLGFGGPQGWQDRRKVLLTNTYLDLIEIVESGKLRETEELLAELPKNQFSPMAVARMAAQAGIFSSERYAESCAIKRIALLALECERERLVSGSYPKSLNDLELSFPISDMTDPDERDLQYELGPNGRPQIWSAHEAEVITEEDGWDGRDGPQLRWQFWSENE